MPPLTTGHLVGDLDPIAVWVPNVDTDGMAVVRHTLDLYVPLFNTEVQLLQVVEAVHIPRHVVESHLPFLGSWGILAHFYQGDFVGVAQVRRHEGSPSGRKAVSMETQEVLIPGTGTLRVPHEDIDVSEFFRLVTHPLPPLLRLPEVLVDERAHLLERLLGRLRGEIAQQTFALSLIDGHVDLATSLA